MDEMDTKNNDTILDTANSLIEKINALRKQIGLLNHELLSTKREYETLLRSYIQSNPKEFTPLRRTPTRCCRFPFFER